jgi:putative copper export protein
MAHEMLPSMGSGIDYHYISMATVRGLWLFPFIVMTGIVGFRLFVFDAMTLRRNEAPWAILIREKIGLFTRRWINISLIFFAIMCLVALIHETMMITGKNVLHIFPYLLTVLEKTHWGRAWVDRAILVALLAIFWGSCLKKEEFPYRWFFVILFLISMTFSLIGHPADRGDYHWSIPLDALHLFAVSLWIGGLFPLFYLAGAVRVKYHSEMTPFLIQVIERFSLMAMIGVAVILITGFYSVWNSWQEIPSWELLTDSNYGNVLTIKLVFVLGTLFCGGLSRFYILPGLRKIGSGDGSRIVRRFFAYLLVELIFAMGVLFFAFFLTQSTPPDVHSHRSVSEKPLDLVPRSGF